MRKLLRSMARAALQAEGVDKINRRFAKLWRAYAKACANIMTNAAAKKQQPIYSFSPVARKRLVRQRR